MDKQNNTKLSQFKQFYSNFTKNIGKNLEAYNDSIFSNLFNQNKQYTDKEIEEIINGNDLTKKRELSTYYYNTSGMYSRLITHYATLPLYSGLLSPSYKKETKINSNNQDFSYRYNAATFFLNRVDFKNLCIHWSEIVLTEGAYFGCIMNLDKKNGVFTVIDLPHKFCRSRFFNSEGFPLVEFDVRFFDQINSKSNRESALSAYPEVIQECYRKYSRTGKDYWVLLEEEGFTFSLRKNGAPPFLYTVPSIERYKKAVQSDLDQGMKESKKYIVQEVPHNNEEYLLEPPEAEEMHRGVAGMLKDDKDTCVITSYGKVTVTESKGRSNSGTTFVDRAASSYYTENGTSQEIFAATGNLSLSTSLVNDLSYMLPLLSQYAKFIEKIINENFGTKSLYFKYTILPVSQYNYKDYLDSALKLATSGYSFIMPALALGISQKELIDLKTLENDFLDLSNKLKPLQTSYTSTTDASTSDGGRTEKSIEDKAPKTIKNIESQD